jgi:hypothetical protein
MKKRDSALRLPANRRVRIAAITSSNVISGCLATSVSNQSAHFSNGETLPPLGFATALLSSCQRRSQLITELGLTSKRSAASRRDAPASTAPIARSRKSLEYGLGIANLAKKGINACRLAHLTTLGNPRFHPGGICSSAANLNFLSVCSNRL